MRKRETLESLVRECLENGVGIVGVCLKGDGLAYEIDGFSKSGTGVLYSEDGKIWLSTRYNQLDEIETFEDIASVAYQWNFDYCNREPFGWDGCWMPVFEKLGWIEKKEVTETIITPKR